MTFVIPPRLVPWAVGLATFLAAAVAFGAPYEREPSTQGRNELLGWLNRAGMPNDWIVFFDAASHGESRWNSDVGLGDPALVPAWVRMNVSKGEARAACRAYDRQVERGKLPAGDRRWCFGSGGYFAMLPANAEIGAFGTDFGEPGPYDLFDPPKAVVMAVAYAKRLRGWSSFRADPTWLTLRVGWSNPSKMADREFRAKVRERFARSLRKAGYPASFMDRRVSAMGWYPGARQLLARLTGGTA